MKFLLGNDVFVSLPTGYSKSLCYAAYLGLLTFLKRDSSNMSKKSIVIVISPLALIKDQLASLSVKGLDVGCITGGTAEQSSARILPNCFFSPKSLLSGSHWRKMLHNELYTAKTVC